MFDAHCHLTDPRVRARATEIWRQAQAAGLEGAALAGVDEEDWQAQRALVAVHPELVPVFGLHPQVVATLAADEIRRQLDALQRLARSSRPPAAIGETGLDRARAADDTLPAQVGAFREQLALARELDLPVVLHVLRAQAAALRIVEADGAPAAGGVVHSYSGSAELVGRWVRLGLHISFAGPVCRPDARRVRLAARAVPDSRLLAETDAPDQRPATRASGDNHPAYLVDVLDALAEVRGATRAEIAALTTDNARSLFRRG